MQKLLTMFLGDRLYNGSPSAVGPLSVMSVLSCLSVTLVYCGHTIGTDSPQFSALICCDQMTGMDQDATY